ncbi:MAG TPA: hypothetical protein VFM34_09210 [Moraxellaceae bacterium]|nr:hypothetical protein [Moraxellaceae bacterium]
MKKFRALICAALMGLAHSAGAAEWQATAGADVRWFDWREYQGGHQLLMERGPLAAPSLGIAVWQEGWFARVDSVWGGGMTRYDGHLQSGPAYSARSWEEILDTHWRAGWQGETLSFNAGLLQRDWRRFIEGSTTVSSAEERYRWRIATVGGSLRLSGMGEPRLSLDIGMPVERHQTVYSRQFDRFYLEPGNGVWWRMAGSWALPKDARFSLEPWYQEQHLADSASVTLTRNGVAQPFQAYQPQSVRRELGVTLRFLLGATH